MQAGGGREYMDLAQMRYVCMVAKTMNFSHAAEALFVAQPTLSQQIQRLECELGVQLFERSTRSVKLTKAGERFVQQSNNILREAKALEDDMAEQLRQIKSVLSVGMLYTLGHLKLPEYLKSFTAHYPNIHIELHSEWSAKLIEMVLSGKLDVAISNIYDEKTNANLRIIPFGEDRISVIMHRSHPLAKESCVTFDMLNGVDFLLLDETSSICRQTLDILHDNHLCPNIVCTCPGTENLITMVEANMGITFFSAGVARQYTRSRELVAVPLTPVQFTQSAMILPAKGKETPAAKLFEDYFWGIVHAGTPFV